MGHRKTDMGEICQHHCIVIHTLTIIKHRKLPLSHAVDIGNSTSGQRANGCTYLNKDLCLGLFCATVTALQGPLNKAEHNT